MKTSEATLSQGEILSQEGEECGEGMIQVPSKEEQRLSLLFGDIAKTSEKQREESHNKLTLYHKKKAIPFAIEGTPWSGGSNTKANILEWPNWLANSFVSLRQV